MKTLEETLNSMHSDPNNQMRTIAQRIDTLQISGGQGVAVADLGASVDLTLVAPTAVDLNAIFSDIEVEAALLAKADQAKVVTMMGVIETRLDNIEAKLNALLASLRNSGQVAS